MIHDDDPIVEALELLDDGRTSEALARLDEAVTHEPDAAGLRALYALVLSDTGRLDDAERHADVAVALDDELPFAHFAAGEVAFAQSRFVDAVKYATTAAELSPDDADPLVLEARARARLGEWVRVRDLAERAQILDPGNEGAVMLAAMADEVQTDAPLDDARWKALAAQFPTNAFARSGRAWAALQAGQVREAREEFEQALALDPSLGWARDGYLAAVKAQNPVYRALLTVLRWLQSFSPLTRNAIIIGALVAYQLLSGVARAQPALRPFIWPVLALYILFLLVSWLADPLLDLALLARAETRRYLSDDAKRGALHVGGALGTGLVLAITAVVAKWDEGLAVAAGIAFTSFPFAGAWAADGRVRRRLLGFAWTAVGLVALSALVPGPVGGTAFAIAILLVVASTWLARLSRRA